MIQLKTLNIAYWFGFIKKDETDTMVERLDRLLQTCKCDTAHPYTTGISQFNAVDPTKLFEALEETITQSIFSMEHSIHGRDRLLKSFTLAKEIPKFNSIDSESIQQRNVVAFSKPDIEDSLSNKIEAIIEEINSTDYLTSSPPKTVQKAKQPFSAGAQHVAYHARDRSSGERYVIKESKYKMSQEDKTSECLTAVRINGVATAYAGNFNVEKPSDVPEVHFVEVQYFQHLKVSNGYTVQESYLCEKFIDGSYYKFNTNNGWVTPNTDLHSCTLQAFSHYSWAKSKKKLVICDLQGVVQGHKIFLTDPAIHCIDYMALQPKAGGSNLGYPGIQKFFSTHKCNEVCHKMKLPLFS